MELHINFWREHNFHYISNMKNLDEMTIEELKCTAYDLIAQQEQTAHNLKLVNQMIAQKYEESKKPKED